MVAGLASAKGEIHDSVHAELANIVQSPSAQVLAQFQREIGRRVRLVLQVLQTAAKLLLHVVPANTQGTTCRQAAIKGCHKYFPRWSRKIQARPNQLWAQCSVFLPPLPAGASSETTVRNCTEETCTCITMEQRHCRVCHDCWISRIQAQSNNCYVAWIRQRCCSFMHALVAVRA